MKVIIGLIIGMLLAFTVSAASLVGVGSGAGAGVIGGTNSSSFALGGAAVTTASRVQLTPNGASGQSATVAIAGGTSASTPNASGGYLAGAIGGSGAGGINSGNAVSGVPIVTPVVGPFIIPFGGF